MTGHHPVNHLGDFLGWETPPDILKALGRFDFDPRVTGLNSLSRPWSGRVFLNPPYDRNIHLWLSRLYNHGDGIALIFARTETRHFHDWVWRRADGVFFFKGRLHFYRHGLRAKDNAGAPSCLVAYGERNDESLRTCSLAGYYVALPSDRVTSNSP